MGRVSGQAATLVLVAVVSGAAEGASVRVPEDYATIPAAVAALASSADPSNTITVNQAGTYAVNLTLFNNLTLQGSETSRVILTAADAAQPIIRMDTLSNVRVSRFSFAGDATAISASSCDTLTISNNVFRVGAGQVAVAATAPGAGVSVVNNTFYGAGTGVSRDADAVTITNNVFAGNGTAISAASAANVSFNGYFSNTSNGQTGSSSVSAADAGFVQPAAGDFHLRTGSAAIDKGTGTDSLDGTVSDLGAFGGTDADTLPFPVGGLAVTAAGGGADSLTLEWDANSDYRVAGYRVHYGPRSGEYTGSNAQSASPINAGAVTTLTLTGFSGSSLAAPSHLAAAPSSERLRFTWDAVGGATGYRLHYGISATTEHQIDVGNVTEFELTGLVNGTAYVADVTAVGLAQQQVYLAVGAVDGTGAVHESLLVSEVSADVSASEESAASNSVRVSPREIDMYPSLPNEGCFIATAAFGYYDATEVQALRELRDRYLKPNDLGSAFVGWYYRHSPPAAQWLNEHAWLKPAVRGALMPAVYVSGVLTGRTSPWPGSISLVLVTFACAASLHLRILRRRVCA